MVWDCWLATVVYAAFNLEVLQGSILFTMIFEIYMNLLGEVVWRLGYEPKNSPKSTWYDSLRQQTSLGISVTYNQMVHSDTLTVFLSDPGEAFETSKLVLSSMKYCIMARILKFK